MRTLIGGVGYRWLRDASFGLEASDALSGMDWPDGIDVADLGYGALYVAQDLAGAQPKYDRLILVAGMPRDREAGQVYSYRWQAKPSSAEEVQARIQEAGAGVIDLDHLLVIAQQLGALPEEVFVIEVEPVEVAGGEGLSAPVAALLPEVIELVLRQALNLS